MHLWLSDPSHVNKNQKLGDISTDYFITDWRCKPNTVSDAGFIGWDNMEMHRAVRHLQGESV